MDSCTDVAHFILLPLDSIDLLSLLHTSKSTRLLINKCFISHVTLWHAKLVRLVEKPLLYRPVLDWNKIYWNFSRSLTNVVHDSSSYSIYARSSDLELDRLGKLAACHLDTLKICRELYSSVFFSHVPLNKITDPSIIQYVKLQVRPHL